jgi:hypothetical protein
VEIIEPADIAAAYARESSSIVVTGGRIALLMGLVSSQDQVSSRISGGLVFRAETRGSASLAMEEGAFVGAVDAYDT